VIRISSSEIHIKQPKTFEEQLEILSKRNLVIDDKQEALSFLKKVNYYRFSAYGLTLKRKDNTELFQDGITFTRMKMIYNFDKKLRELLVYYLESVEIEFRTKIAYYHAHDYGALGYKNAENFKSKSHHIKFIEKLEKDIDKSGKELFVMHHKSKYNGVFPFWVAIEVMSFGGLSKLFRNLLRDTKIKVIQDLNTPPPAVASWLHSLSYIRNVCAHYGRLYGKDMVIKPSLKNKSEIKNNRVFAIVFVLTKLLHRDERINLFTGLEALLEEFSDYISLEEIGFPVTWQEIFS
jgi:abortive infection bacteriophage resistance protein